MEKGRKPRACDFGLESAASHQLLSFYSLITADGSGPLWEKMFFPSQNPTSNFNTKDLTTESSRYFYFSLFSFLFFLSTNPFLRDGSGPFQIAARTLSQGIEWENFLDVEKSSGSLYRCGTPAPRPV